MVSCIWHLSPMMGAISSALFPHKNRRICLPPHCSSRVKVDASSKGPMFFAQPLGILSIMPQEKRDSVIVDWACKPRPYLQYTLFWPEQLRSYFERER